MVRSKYSVKKKRKSVLNSIIRFFASSPYKAYLVGGAVRDMILKKDTKDIDITVEGNAITAGIQLNKILNGKMELHKQFGTVTITTSDFTIDLATARTETYPQPGSLPIVSDSNIYEDLKRRDFSINAIAIGISKCNYGEILDPCNGFSDINRGLIRILHKGSFIDDPTRIFRALRYKHRLNFKLEKTTRKLLKDAVLKGVLNRVSKQRILNELKLIFQEQSCREIILDLHRLRIFSFNKEKIKNIADYGNLKYYYFLSQINTKNYPLSNHEKRLIHAINQIDTVRKKLKKAKTNSVLFNILSGIDKEIIEVIPNLFPDLKVFIKRYEKLRKIKPFITGRDLQKLNIKPGPAYKKILQSMFAFQLDGIIKDKKTAMRYLRNV